MPSVNQTSEQNLSPSYGPWRAQTLLALLSGAPALMYEIVWTREVALIVGSQVQAISTVLAAFFGGLAAGAWALGGAADRARSPLRLYGVLEIAAGALAVASPLALRLMGERLVVQAPSWMVLALAAMIVFLTTFLLGGTLPALLRSVVRDPRASAGASGWLVGVNTAGAVAGVATAAALIPWIGLQITISLAGAGGVLIGLVAIVLPASADAPREEPAAAPAALDPVERRRVPVALLVAMLGGVGTLGFEVLAARAASLLLGSSLLAWALVLGLFLIGLSLGNLLAATRAGRSPQPRTDLGIIEAAAGLLVLIGTGWVVGDPATPATGLSGRSVGAIAAWAVPATLLMGAAFPLYVRLAVRRPGAIGAAFGAVSAANTAGGIVGAILGPFLLLPVLGLRGGLIACAALNAALGLALLAWGADDRASRLLRPALAAVVLAVGGFIGIRPMLGGPPPGGPRLIHVTHGRQATAVVARVAGRRDLIVDGDPEASTGSNARVTEELLGTLPPLLHPDARTFLEIGLGSGITLGAASTSALERLQCVEISRAVIDCAPFFEPDNRGVASGANGRVTLIEGDGRAFLLRHPDEYDVIVANTLHPWSVGATGLYSAEYFGRIRRALHPGGIAAQWLPLARLGADHLAAILRTFYGAFPDGELWWGEENLIVIGHKPGVALVSEEVLRQRYDAVASRLRPFGIDGFADLRCRRLATARTVLETIGPGVVLSDDRPLLEAGGSLRRARGSEGGGGELELVARIVAASAEERPELRGMELWLRAGVARLAGDEPEALRLEEEAERTGLSLVAKARSRRAVVEGLAALGSGRSAEAQLAFGRALDEDHTQPHARFGMAVIAATEGRAADARRHLDQLLTFHPAHAEGWNLMATLRFQTGDAAGALE
ncbi:MAG: spermidine synthase, partial [Planctomycetota bacterium]